MSGQIIRSAINEKSTTLKMQIFCKIEIKNFNDDVVVIIVPKLNRNFILGYDFLKYYSLRKEISFINFSEIMITILPGSTNEISVRFSIFVIISGRIRVLFIFLLYLS